MKKKRLLKPAGEAKQKFKARPPTEIERKMGQIVLDFANAETTDAACFKHFENMQEFAERTMAFSRDSTERAKETFPAFYRLHSSLTDPEREFLRLTINTVHLKIHINEVLEAFQLEIECYNPETSTLTVLEVNLDTEVREGISRGSVSGSNPVEMTVDEFKSELDTKVGMAMLPFISGGLDEFVEMEKQISTLKNSISESRINELKKMMSDSEKHESLRELNRILDLQTSLQNILGGIVENTPFYDLPGFGNYLDKYSELPLSRFMVTEDLLIEIPPISEDFYFDRNGRDRWFSRFQTDLTYCLIGFLKGEGNRKYIAKCLWCEKFFIRTKYNPTNPQKFCRYSGGGCKDDWHYRERVKSGKAAKYIKNGRAEGKYQ